MKLTEKLGLKKPDLTDYVNIGDLNDNMDVLDEEVGSLKEGTTEVVDLETLDKTYKGAINELDAKVKSHKADLASQDVGKGADIIGLPDPNNLFNATNVGGAMNELFTNVSDGKQLVGGAITGVDDSIVIPTDPTFNDLSTAIGSISTGKKWAVGNSAMSSAGTFDFILRNGSTVRTARLTVTGLNFKPSTVIVFSDTSAVDRTLVSVSDASKLWEGFTIITSSSGTQLRLTNPAVIEYGGFVLPVYTRSNPYNWMAFE